MAAKKMATKKSAVKKQKTKAPQNTNSKKGEVILLLAITATILLMLGLYFETGSAGRFVSRFMRGMMGPVAYVFPVYLAIIFIHSIIKKNPEKYKTLVVRVAGYSALFTTLSRSLQDYIINRTEQGF